MIGSHIDITKDLTIYDCTGLITIEEVRNTLTDYYQGTPTRYNIWDFTKSNFYFNNSAEVRELAHDVNVISHSRNSGKSAIICSEDFNYAVCRMYQAFSEAEHYNIPIAVFRTTQEAEQWIFEELCPSG